MAEIKFRSAREGDVFTDPLGLGGANNPDEAVQHFPAQRPWRSKRQPKTMHEINNVTDVPRHMPAFLALAGEGRVLLPGVAALQLGTTLAREPLRAQICEHLTPNLCVRYGINEVGTVSCAVPADLASGPPGTVGTPAPGVSLGVIDDHGNTLPRGEAGELRVKSAGMVDGYVDDPEAGLRSFRDGWFHTGDCVAFTPDGFLIHHGRADDMMIFDGINFRPVEIENVILGHPAVVEAAAVPLYHPVRGDVPVVAVVLRSPVAQKELLAYCRSWLGARTPLAVKAVPKLPKNALGKVMKKDIIGYFKLRQNQTAPRLDSANRRGYRYT